MPPAVLLLPLPPPHRHDQATGDLCQQRVVPPPPHQQSAGALCRRCRLRAALLPILLFLQLNLQFEACIRPGASYSVALGECHVLIVYMHAFDRSGARPWQLMIVRPHGVNMLTRLLLAIVLHAVQRSD